MITKEQQIPTSYPSQAPDKDYYHGAWHRTTDERTPPGRLSIRPMLQPGSDQVRMKFENFPDPWLDRELVATYEGGYLNLTLHVEDSEYTFHIEGYDRAVGRSTVKHLHCAAGQAGGVGPVPEGWDAEEGEGGGISEVETGGPAR